MLLQISVLFISVFSFAGGDRSPTDQPRLYAIACQRMQDPSGHMFRIFAFICFVCLFFLS